MITNDTVNNQLHPVFDHPEICSEIRGVIQIGAGYGEEVKRFQALGWHQIYIEPVDRAAAAIRKKISEEFFDSDDGKLTREVHCCAIAPKTGFVSFNLCGPHNSNSSSILPFSSVATKYNPRLVTEKTYSVPAFTLHDFLSNCMDLKKYNFIHMDVQGAEWDVMKSAIRNRYFRLAPTLKYIKYVYSEVNHAALYDGTKLFSEFNELMFLLGFRLVDLVPLIKSSGTQSNALFERLVYF